MNIFELVKRLYPICRSITGDGVRQTLAIIQGELPDLRVVEVPSGTQVFDWTIPDEWNVAGARLVDPDGRTIVDFAEHNLHLVGYSEPVDRLVPLEELQEHLYSRPDFPDAIPYVTSYYKRWWGFCLRHSLRERLHPGLYHVSIDSTLKPGHLTYGELIIPGRTTEEIFLSTYICHPSMANNELSGPAVAVELAKWILSTKRRYTYRLIFVPETIGSITYLSRNLEHLQRHVAAGFNLTCLGDERAYSYLPSRQGDTLADRIALHVLRHYASDFLRYTFLNRGSDERQYCSPGVDLPICSVMRSKYGAYPEYHTSLDNFDLVTEAGLRGGFEMMRYCLEGLEKNLVFRRNTLCEPNLGRRGLYPTLSTVGGRSQAITNMMNILAYTDGKASLLDIAEAIGLDILTCFQLAEQLHNHEVLESSES